MVRIAIVDDSRLARTFTMGCLKKLGYGLLEIDPTSLSDVMKALRENPPDVILLDYLMPNCPGVTLVSAIREEPKLKASRIIMISAHHDDEIHAYLKRQGVDAFLAKPFDPKVLVEMLLDLLEP